MAAQHLLDMESDLREVAALSDVLHAMGSSERAIDNGTVYVLAGLLERAAQRLQDQWQAAVDCEGEPG